VVEEVEWLLPLPPPDGGINGASLPVLPLLLAIGGGGGGGGGPINPGGGATGGLGANLILASKGTGLRVNKDLASNFGGWGGG
jgi:hypothetical protein